MSERAELEAAQVLEERKPADGFSMSKCPARSAVPALPKKTGPLCTLRWTSLFTRAIPAASSGRQQTFVRSRDRQLAESAATALKTYCPILESEPNRPEKSTLSSAWLHWCEDRDELIGKL